MPRLAPSQGRAERAHQGDDDGPHGRPAWSVSQGAVKSGNPILVVASGFKAVSLVDVQDRKDRSRILGRSEQQLAEFDAIDRKRLDRLAQDLKQAGASDVHTDIAHGSPIQEVLRRAAETPDTLVVMGTQVLWLPETPSAGFAGHCFRRVKVAGPSMEE